MTKTDNNIDNNGKIIHVGYLLAPISYGGGERLVVDIIKRLKKVKGMSIKLFSLTFSLKLNENLEAENIQKQVLTRIKVGYSQSQFTHLRLSLLASFVLFFNCKLFDRYDILHIHSFSILIAFWLLKRLHRIGKCKIVYTHHALKQKVNSEIIRFIYSSILDTADAIVGGSGLATKQLSLNFSRLSDKILTIPNGIDTIRFKCRTRKILLRRKLKLPLNNVLAVYVARALPSKNHEFLVQLAKKVISTDYRILLIGEGLINSEIERRMEEFGVREKFILRGYVEDRLLPLYFRASDFCVFPSLAEGGSVSILEALSSGLPLLIFNCIYSPEYKYALRAKNNSEFITHFQLLLNREHREPLKVGLQKSVSSYDVQTTADNYQKLYEKILIKTH